MSLLAAWLLFPAVALLICAALGLLAERAAGDRIPGVLVLPLGMAALVCLTQLPTFLSATAEATLPLVVVAALAGLWLGRERLRTRPPDPWAAGAALGAFLVAGAPVLLSGEATFAGYTVLGDTSIHFIGADALLEYGRQYGPLAPSSYEFSLIQYYGSSGYPSGGPTAVAALTSLAGLDVAWSFQPFLSLLIALTALALYSLAEPVIPSRALRAGVALLAAVPALSVAYALQGSVKEVGTAFGVVLIGALLAPWARQAGDGARRVIPLVVAASATVGIVGLAAAVWLGPFALAAVLIAVFGERRAGLRRLLGAAALAAGLTAVLCYQALADLATYVDVAGGIVQAQGEFGNLLGPLDGRQRFGVWLSGDYRVPPIATMTETRLLLLGVWVAMAAGALLLLRTRPPAAIAFLLVSVLAHVVVMRRGSPWADGKALMIVSPAMVLLAGLGAALLWRWRRLAGWAVLGGIGLGVLWSDALAYHDVSNAPRERMAELQKLGERLDGEGPTLYPEFEEFAKHFLRQGAPEGPTEGWQRRYELSAGRDGTLVRQGFSVDLDRFTDRYLREWDAIVLRRGFASSRPGMDFERTWTGRFYELWQRRADPKLIEHASFGDFRQPVGPADCGVVRRLARKAQAEGGRLAYVERPPNSLASPATVQPLPNGWYVDPTDGSAIVARGRGRMSFDLEVTGAGSQELWLEGSFGRGVSVSVDGRRVGSVAYRLNGRGAAELIGRVNLPAGRHTVTLERGGGSLYPGNGGGRLIGPVALTPPDPTGLPVRFAEPDRAREICGRSVDWVEALRG